jgi:hypothetical protein
LELNTGDNADINLLSSCILTNDLQHKLRGNYHLVGTGAAKNMILLKSAAWIINQGVSVCSLINENI